MRRRLLLAGLRTVLAVRLGGLAWDGMVGVGFVTWLWATGRELDCETVGCRIVEVCGYWAGYI